LVLLSLGAKGAARECYNEHMANKKVISGKCRVCGKEKKLSLEHIIPRAGGGAEKIKLYTGEELLKTLGNNPRKPYGKIMQNGYSAHTLCKECNEKLGQYYDKDFALFLKVINYNIPISKKSIKPPDGTSMNDYLENVAYQFTLKKMKPFNIAKRTLASFCSVEHAGLTDSIPEIRRAILEKEYKPNTNKFSLYLCLHLGEDRYFGTIAAANLGGEIYTYAGIEVGSVAFYLTRHAEKRSNGPKNCVDITNWLNDFDYNQEVSLNCVLPFHKSLMIQFPIPND
jgi:5-methylcytosine-specific restriction endonuclease McrA